EVDGFREATAGFEEEALRLLNAADRRDVLNDRDGRVPPSVLSGDRRRGIEDRFPPAVEGPDVDDFPLGTLPLGDGPGQTPVLRTKSHAAVRPPTLVLVVMSQVDERCLPPDTLHLGVRPHDLSVAVGETDADRQRLQDRAQLLLAGSR